MSDIPDVYRRSDNPLVSPPTAPEVSPSPARSGGSLDLKGILDIAREFVPLLSEVTANMVALRGAEGATPRPPAPSALPPSSGSAMTGADLLDLVVGELGKVPAGMTASQMISYAIANRESILPQLEFVMASLFPAASND